MEIVITNNPMVRDKLSGARAHKPVEFHNTDYLGVLKAVRDRIHLGHGLLTHPLSGSVKPGETPYKTVIISAEKNSLDEKALFIIDDSIQTCLKFMANGASSGCGVKKNREAEILEDFQLIDYSLIFSERF